MPLTVEQFTQRLTSSGVMSEESLLDALSPLSGPECADGEQLARELVKRKVLTKFQAEQIYAGKEKSLTLGNYVILDKLGQGGMGMVLKAMHRRMKRLVAIKVMSPAAVKTPDSLKRFHREVEAAAKLSHPNIVAAHDADEAKGTHFLVMEFVDGTDLSMLVKKHGPLPAEQAIQCIIQAARGLEFAHEQGVIHRDIKPANLLIDAKGTVKILDMGLARIENSVGGSSEGAGLTSTGTIMGTVDYMSPEQAMDTKHADARSDIYSLGCSLYYLLTGKVVYDGDTIMKKLMAHQNAPIPSLSSPVAPRQDSRTSVEVGTSIDNRTGDARSAFVSRSDTATLEALDAVFRRMVAKKPEDRPQSMTEVIAELERCLSGGSATVAFERSASSATSVAASGASGSGNELQDFLRQISGGEPATATSGKASGTVVTPSSAEAATMISSADDAGTDPRTESRLHAPREDSRTVADTGRANDAQSGSTSVVRLAFLTRSVRATLAAVAVLVLLAILFVSRGKSGTLHLEINDNLIEVTFGDTGRTVKGKTTHKLRVPLGEMVLHVEREDLAFDTDPFEVTKGEPVSIKVERVGRAVRALHGKTLLGRQEDPSPKSDPSSPAAKSLVTIQRRAGKFDVVAPGYQAKVNSDGLLEKLEVAGATLIETTNFGGGGDFGRIGLGGVVKATQSEATLLFQQAGDYRLKYEFDADGFTVRALVSEKAAQRDTVDKKSFYLFYEVLFSNEAVTVRPLDGSDEFPLPADKLAVTSRFAVTFKNGVELEVLSPPSEAFFKGLNQPTNLWSHGYLALDTDNIFRFDIRKPATSRPALRSSEKAYVDLPTLKLAGDRPITIEAWVQNPGQTGIGVITETFGERGFGLYYGDRQWAFTTHFEGRATDRNTAMSLGATQGPVHVAGVWDGQQVRLFVDGVSSGQSRVGNFSHRKEGGAILGAQRLTNGDVIHFFQGDILAVRFSDGQRYKANFTPAKTLQADATTLALYHFDEGSGDVLKDSSGNNHHGKIVGAKWVRVGDRSTDVAEPATAEINLLSLIDPGSHAIKGTWRVSQGELLSDQTLGAMIQIPHQPPAEYDLQLTFTRRAGTGVIAPVLVKGDRQFQFDYAGWNGDIFAFGKVDGRRTNANSTTVRRPPLVNGRKYTALLQVRNDHAKAWLDGELISELKTDYSNVSPDDLGALRDSRSLGLVTNAAWTIHSLTLVPVGGNRAAARPTQSTPPASMPPTAVAPFDAKAARSHQDAWAKHLGVPVEYTNSIGMKFVLIPPGEFQMGSTPEEIEEALVERSDKFWQDCVKSEAPRHKVILTQPFYLGATEVTQAEYEKVMGKNPSDNSPAGKNKEKVAGLDTTRHPVEAVYWNDAAEFCAKLSQQEKLKPFYFRAGLTVTPLDGTGYRLPTEAEWEYACRAGTVSKFWFGDKDEDLVRAGWFQGNAGGRTHPVGELKANPFGLFDMHGNAWEWVQDVWDANWYEQFREAPATNPTSPFTPAPSHVIRGGSRGHSAMNNRSALRHARGPTALGPDFGFRVSLPVDAVKQQLAQRDATTPPPAVAPFDAKQARAHQEAWAKHLGTQIETTNTVGAKMLLLPPGEFLMGSSDGQIEAVVKRAQELQLDRGLIEHIQKAERPQHTVTITKPFLMSATEVTIGQFKKFSASGYLTPAEKAKNEGKPVRTYLNVVDMATDDLPAGLVTWDDAVEFCRWLSREEQATYRLPTEAEWEYACRAGTATLYSFGDDDSELKRYGWFAENVGDRMRPVGLKRPNAYGLFDLHGGQLEWCSDLFDQEWYEESPANDPKGSLVGGTRIQRGGSYGVNSVVCRSAYRAHGSPFHAHGTVGFRIVREVGNPTIPQK